MAFVDLVTEVNITSNRWLNSMTSSANVFKFQVNRMKFEDFRKFGSNWPIGLRRPFWSTKFFETSTRDHRIVVDIYLRKFWNDRLSGLYWRRVDRQTDRQTNKQTEAINILLKNKICQVTNTNEKSLLE